MLPDVALCGHAGTCHDLHVASFIYRINRAIGVLWMLFLMEKRVMFDGLVGNTVDAGYKNTLGAGKMF